MSNHYLDLNLDADRYNSAKIDLPILVAFITYLVNTQPAAVALCHEYEQPVKDLLNGKQPTLALTQEQVRRAIDRLSNTVDCDECAHAPWKRINENIGTDVFEVLST